VSKASERLAKLGIELPKPPKPVASYVPFKAHNGLVFCSGQLPFVDGELTARGICGADVDVDTAQKAARAAAINAIAALAEGAGGIDKIDHILRLTGYVAATSDFTEHPFVINGASELFQEVFGEDGVHSRAAIGVSSLPLGACVEIDAIAATK
jgi:enamine deaminase RidA (YjgF/YER057c/UK114 family)